MTSNGIKTSEWNQGINKKWNKEDNTRYERRFNKDIENL
jgi:hypothetical protein